MRIYDNTEFLGHFFIKSKFIDRIYITSVFPFALFYAFAYSHNNKITDKDADYLVPPCRWFFLFTLFHLFRFPPIFLHTLFWL